MKKDEAIKWVDDRMCWGRGTWTEHHQPNIDDCWQAGQMAIEALKAQEHDNVSHPSHYTDGNIEVIDYIEDKGFGYHLGNAIKYISRAGKKDPKKTAEDLRKAVWYIERYIGLIEGEEDVKAPPWIDRREK